MVTIVAVVSSSPGGDCEVAGELESRVGIVVRLFQYRFYYKCLKYQRPIYVPPTCEKVVQGGLLYAYHVTLRLFVYFLGV